jgi:hypothetical protein
VTRWLVWLEHTATGDLRPDTVDADTRTAARAIALNERAGPGERVWSIDHATHPAITEETP